MFCDIDYVFCFSSENFVGTVRLCSLNYSELAVWRVLPSSLHLFLSEVGFEGR